MKIKAVIRILSFLLCLMLAVGVLAACDDQKSGDPTSATTTQQQGDPDTPYDENGYLTYEAHYGENGWRLTERIEYFDPFIVYNEK